MLARLASVMLGMALLHCGGGAQAQVQPAENPATLQAACDRNDFAASIVTRPAASSLAFTPRAPVSLPIWCAPSRWA